MSLFKKNTDFHNLNGKILFINASEHENGTTSRLGQRLLDGKNYTQLNLVDYKIYQLSQKFADDQFNKILQAIDEADTIILGAPIYWHMISGYAKVFLERLSRDSNGILPGKKMGVFIHGSNPSDAVDSAKNLMNWFTRVEKLDNLGVLVL